MLLRVLLPSGRTKVFKASWDRESSPLGWRVLVPTERGGTTGIVIGVQDGEAPEEILSFPDSAPVVSYAGLSTVDELSLYYLIPKGVLLFKLLPAVFLWRERKVIKPAQADPIGLDRRSGELFDYIKKRRGVSPESLKKRFGAELVDFMLKKGLLKLVKEWKAPSVEERFYRLGLSLKEALSMVRSDRKKKLLVYLSGRKCVSEEELAEWGFDRSLLRDLVRRNIVEELQECGDEKTFPQNFTNTVNVHAEDRLLFWGKFRNALELALNECRRNLSQGKSTLLIFTDREELNVALGYLRESLGDKVIEIHSGVSFKRLFKAWFKARESPHVIVGTYTASLCPLYSPGTFILFNESAPGVKIKRLPSVDLRRLLLVLSQKNSSRIVFTTPAPSVASFYLHLQGKFSLKRDMKEARIHLIRREPTQILTPELEKFIEKNLHRDTLFLVPKQGYSYAYCPRCEALAECPYCGSFLTFSKVKERIYCTSCGYKHRSWECPECDGELELAGFGLERAVEVIESRFGLRENFSFGTHPVWEEEHENVVILSVDNILSVPSYRSVEDSLLYVLKARSVAKHNLFVQSILPETFKELSENRVEDIYVKELKSREEELLPPFWRLVLVRIKRKELLGYFRKFVSPHLRSSFNLREGSYDLLIPFRDRQTLLKISKLRKRFPKDIIEVRIDPF